MVFANRDFVAIHSRSSEDLRWGLTLFEKALGNVPPSQNNPSITQKPQDLDRTNQPMLLNYSHKSGLMEILRPILQLHRTIHTTTLTI
mmetsp:Transcript_45290/g.53029  ORF Transcript_45290/g.53029 Transcript_45290/m.53029 type:complete len:88 (+) Transcript_45290:161-424(+)